MSTATKPTLHIVHCIDTEGPLTEDIDATFQRINAMFALNLAASADNLRLLQQQKIPLQGMEADVARVVAPALLSYNNSWQEIEAMLSEAMASEFRNKMTDDRGHGWVYSWHCMDHAGYSDNPRRKDLGYGNVFRFYKQKIAETHSTQDEINWHFHPLSFTRNPLQCASSYVNSYDVLMQILTRRLIDEGWYPVTNRPGFHTERPDSHAFLEQWIPYDYANLFDTTDDGQRDVSGGRFGDWRRASASWAGYHPHHDDYQAKGGCRRWIFRCLNVGTRFKTLGARHVEEAFLEARQKGSAILAFSNHDYRDIRPDVHYVRDLLAQFKPSFPDVTMLFSGATQAARAHTNHLEPRTTRPIKLGLRLEDGVLSANVSDGELFGPQPMLAIKTRDGCYYHDNFDIQHPRQAYSYTFDHQTILPHSIEVIAVGAAGSDGSHCVERLVL